MATESSSRRRAPRAAAAPASKAPRPSRRAGKDHTAQATHTAADEASAKRDDAADTTASPHARETPAWTDRASAVAEQVGEALGHAVGSVQVEARRVVVDGSKLLHRARGEARDLSREAVRQAKAHPWAASGLVVGTGALIGAAVAGYNRVRGQR